MQKGGCGLICEISPIAFDYLPVNQYFVAQSVLVQGVVDHGGIPIDYVPLVDWTIIQ